jgi:hypothetical protein
LVRVASTATGVVSEDAAVVVDAVGASAASVAEVRPEDVEVQHSESSQQSRYS